MATRINEPMRRDMGEEYGAEDRSSQGRCWNPVNSQKVAQRYQRNHMALQIINSRLKVLAAYSCDQNTDLQASNYRDGCQSMSDVSTRRHGLAKEPLPWSSRVYLCFCALLAM
jgi:hypothetical protein